MSSDFSVLLPNVSIVFHVKHGAADMAATPAQPQQKSSVFHVKHEQQANLLLAGGREPACEWLKRVAQANALAVYCADKGVNCALAAQLAPQLVVGDCDSSSPAFYEQAQVLGAKLELHPPAKDDTDLQLLLKSLSPAPLVASGIWGGRFDHLFSNVYSLLQFKKQHDTQVLLADEHELMVLLCSEEEVTLQLEHAEKVQALSLIPLSATAVVSLDGVRWPLAKAALKQQHPYAISNEVIAEFIQCLCHEGDVGLYIHWNA